MRLCWKILCDHNMEIRASDDRKHTIRKHQHRSTPPSPRLTSHFVTLLHDASSHPSTHQHGCRSLRLDIYAIGSAMNGRAGYDATILILFSAIKAR